MMRATAAGIRSKAGYGMRPASHPLTICACFPRDNGARGIKLDCPPPNSANIHKTTNAAIRDILRRFYEGILYLQTVMQFHGTHLNL